MRDMKDHMMRHEGTHPVNNTEVYRFKHDTLGEMHGDDPNSHGAELQMSHSPDQLRQKAEAMREQPTT